MDIMGAGGCECNQYAKILQSCVLLFVQPLSYNFYLVILFLFLFLEPIWLSFWDRLDLVPIWLEIFVNCHFLVTIQRLVNIYLYISVETIFYDIWFICNCIFVAIILTWCLFICQVSSCLPLWEYAKVNNLRSREVTHMAIVSFRLRRMYAQLPILSIYVLATSLHFTENFT